METVRRITPAGGPVGEILSTERPEGPAPMHEEERMSVMVGHEAPDFEANGFHKGGWGKFKLSDYKGKWVVLCFYPGDFTYV